MRGVPPSAIVVFHAYTDLPKKVYVSSNSEITLRLERVDTQIAVPSNNPKLLGNREQRVIIWGVLHGEIGCDLEVVLMGVPGGVEDKKVQQLRLDEEIPRYYWICQFPNIGDFNLALSPKVLHPKRTRPLDPVKWRVKVVQFMNLTAQELFVCKAVAGIATFLSIVIGFLYLLAQLFHFWGH